HANDTDVKVVEYHKAGVPLYFIVDSRPGEDDRVAILGYRSTPEGYVRILPDDRGRVWVEPLRVWLASEGPRVVCLGENGQRLAEAYELAGEVRAMNARLEVLQSATEEAITARHQAEKDNVQAEKDKAQAEKDKADMATRLADLEAELKRFRGA